ncbi:hypothetical protein SAMN04488135_109176 [Pollutimonas bauzanensis]|uniref:Uncharacterized protein n=1 Tax=Pollutimonas bauzanensis TaxID=658167 RepID=A0A1M5YKG9_9BURK|nr:hypothetical protein SAMN04488135_109176 [Pollutimonas bauzanensis]
MIPMMPRHASIAAQRNKAVNCDPQMVVAMAATAKPPANMTAAFLTFRISNAFPKSEQFKSLAAKHNA